MAKRRMFSLDVVDTDRFLDMPASTQSLYFHLGMRADDDGFVSSPKKIAAICGCNADDIKLLITKDYLIPFDEGVVVITHWKMNNYIQRDRYNKTIYQDYANNLEVDNMLYRLDTECIHDVSQTDTQDRLGKDSIGKDSIGKDNICADAPKRNRSQFKPPSLDEVEEYCRERNNYVDAERFVDYYAANGWMVGKNKMKDWKAAVRTWEKNQYNNSSGSSTQKEFDTSEDNKSFYDMYKEMMNGNTEEQMIEVESEIV